MTTSDPLDEKKLFQLASLIGCEPEDEDRHRQQLVEYIQAWHLQKCRSYLPSKMSEDVINIANTIINHPPKDMAKDSTYKDSVNLAKGFNNCLDIITKRIEGDK